MLLAPTLPPTPTVRRAALWALLVAHLIGYWGILWDTLWHVSIGRDSFWIAPHVMVYTGVTLVVAVAFGVLAWETFRARDPERRVRLLGLSGTLGFHLAAWGIALTVLAAPIDDLWHRLFGLDVTIWSPPHLMGLLGATASLAGCLIIAGEVYPQRPRARLVAMVPATALMYAYLHLMVDPTVWIAYLHGGLLFYGYPMLAALILPPPLVVTTRRSGQRWTPLLVLVALMAIVLAGHQIARLGFAVLQPVSVIEDAISQDPTSPIAVAHRIARKNGTEPGHLSPWAGLIAVALPIGMVIADARRRPVIASVVYAATIFAVMAILLPRSPAFRPLTPSLAQTFIAFAVTMLTALAGGIAARRLA